jgi:hypothetical protein
LKPEDSGTYECFLPTGQSDRVSLLVSDPNSRQNAQQENQPATQYAIRSYIDRANIYNAEDTETQTCTGMTNGNSLDIEWYNPRGEQVRNDGKFSIEIKVTSEAPLTKVSTLKMHNANDYYDGGRYECRILVGSQKESSFFEVLTRDGN